jgi:hypothetical protein
MYAYISWFSTHKCVGTLANHPNVCPEQDSYAARSLSNFAKWRRGEKTDDVRRFDLQRPEDRGRK